MVKLVMVVALALTLPAYASTPSVPKVKLIKKKATTKTVAYACKGKKTVTVTYDVSAKGVPTSAKVTLDKKARQLATVGKANRFTVNFAHGEYSLSLDKSKLPVTKAPIMIFKTVPAKDIKAEPEAKKGAKSEKGKKDKKAAVSAKAKATLAKLKNGTRILYSGCQPKGS